MNKKIKIILVILAGALSGLYVGYKVFNISNYSLKTLFEGSYQDFLNSYKTKDEIVLETKDLNEEEYIEFENIKIINRFQDFEILDQNKDYIKYILYDDEKNIQAFFWIAITDNYINSVKSDFNVYGMEDNKVQKVNLKNFVKNNKLTTDLELFDYLYQNKDVKNNLFTPVKTMKEKYALNLFALISFPSIYKLTTIRGEYEGYILYTNNNVTEINILKNDKKYVLTFFSQEYFNQKYMIEILNTLKIE